MAQVTVAAPHAGTKTDLTERGTGGHSVNLFTGQWADLPFEEVARLAIN